MNFIEILTGIKAWTNNKLSGKYEKPSSGIPKTDLKQDVQELLSRTENSVATKLLELDGTGVEFSPSLEPFILVAMNTNDIAVYHVSASTSLTPEANIIRLVYSSTSSLLKFYYYEDNVVAWSDGEVSLYYCNLSGSYYDFEFYDGSLQRLEEDGVLLPIEEFATKSDLTAKYEKPSAGIPKSDLASSVQSSLNKADTAYQKPSNGIPDTDMTESVRRCLELADNSATLNRYIIEGGHGLKFVASTNSYLVRIENGNEEYVYLIFCGDDYTNTQVTALTYSIPSGVSFYICGEDQSLLIWASTASRFSIISLRENGAIDSEIIDEMPEDVEEIAPGTYATDLDLALKQDKATAFTGIYKLEFSFPSGNEIYQFVWEIDEFIYTFGYIFYDGILLFRNKDEDLHFLSYDGDTYVSVVDHGKFYITPVIGNISDVSVPSQIPQEADIINPIIPYYKPSTGIPASDIASGVIPDVSQFITKSVNDLTNYYLKSETYTQAEVNALIGAIQQFHYEIYEALPGTGSGNVLYLIGPTGTGSDRYEEYVYANGAFTKIGDTSIDLSQYVTTQALNTALADYTTTANLSQLLSQKENISNKTTSLSSESTYQQYPAAKAVYDFVTAAIGGAIDETYPQNE